MPLIDMPAGADLFDTDALALVNTVNCVGVMGKGVALGVKQRWPSVYRVYRNACQHNEVAIGSILMTIVEEPLPANSAGPIYVLNLPTKIHWRNPSQLAWIDTGLTALRQVIINMKLDSVALPPPGCGNGGLAWSDVEPLIITHLADLDADIEVYRPAGQP